MNRFYRFLIHLTMHRRKLLVLVLVTLTLLFAFLAKDIRLETSMFKLLGPKTEVMKAYHRWKENYPYSSSVYIVLQGEDTEEIIKAGDQLSNRLKEDTEWVRDSRWKEEMEYMRNNSLMLTETEDLKDLRTNLEDHPQMMSRTFQGFNLGGFLKGINDNLSDYDTGESVKEDEDDLVADMEDYNHFITFLGGFTKGKASPFQVRRSLSDLFQAGDEDQDVYIDEQGHIISRDGTVALMQVTSIGDASKFIYGMKFVNHLRKVTSKLESNYPEVQIGLTGFPVIAADEYQAMTYKLFLGFIISIVGILLLFIIGFRQLLMPVMAGIPLLIGIVWSTGIAAVTVGKLNLFAMMAPVILLGLGIDYAIHIISKYQESRADGMGIEDALNDVYHKIGHGLAIGAFTTAAAFFAILFAGFKGMNEFGIIGGIFVIGAFISMVTILPLLISALDKRFFQGKEGEVPDVEFKLLGTFSRIFSKVRFSVLALVCALLVFGFFSVTHLSIEKDVLKIEPKGLESIKLQRLIIDKFNFSIYTSYGMLNDLDTVYQKARLLEEKSTVKRTESLADYLPSQKVQAERRKITEDLTPYINKISPITDKSVDKGQILVQLDRLSDNLVQLKTLSYLAGLTELVKKIEGVESSLKSTRSAIKDAGLENLRSLNSVIYDKLKLEYLTLKEGINDLTISKHEVPQTYFDRYQGRDGSYLLTVFPSQYVWKSPFYKKHLNQVKSILDNPTGIVPIWGEILERMIPGTVRAGLASMLVIGLLLLVDFRSIRRTIAIMIPLCTALFLALALMPLMGMKVNLVNIMALPLVLGIGIDDAVHLYHRYLVERDIVKAFTSTGKAVTLTTLTTIAALLSLTMSPHRGMVSFALLASIGIGLCLVVDLIMLPPLIRIFENHKSS